MKSPIVIAAGVLAIAALLYLSFRSHRTLERGLCPRTVLADESSAYSAASELASANGGVVLSILGTGSMAPFIPAAAAGKDPRATVVAFVVLDPAATFADIQPGQPCVYFARWAGGLVFHGAAERTSRGWIMSGLANARSESWEPMTAENFRGIAAHAFTWPQ